MYKISLFLLLLTSICFSQRNFGKVVYEQFFRDSNTQRIQTELIFLDSVSLYKWNYSKNRIKKKKQSNKFEEIYHLNTSKKDSYFYLNRSNKKLITRLTLNKKEYFIDNDYNSYDWEIIDSIKKIDKYECRLARTVFKNKTYYAWYAKNIPLPFGPNKFHDLPGLILELKDSEGNMSFRIKKLTVNTEKVKNDIVKEFKYLNIESKKIISSEEYDRLVEVEGENLEKRLNARRPKGSKPIKFKKTCDTCNEDN